MPLTTTVNHEAIELIERFARCLLQDTKTKDDISAIKELGSYITYFSNAAVLNTQQDEIFKKFIDMVDSSTEKLDSSEVIKQFCDEVENVKANLNNCKKCAKYEEFMKMIEENLGDDGVKDEDIETVSESINTIDPITKLPIVDPVKNKKCGHSYEKMSILQLIANNPKTRCPIPGCSASHFVKKNDLVPDLALKRLLSQPNAMQTKRTS